MRRSKCATTLASFSRIGQIGSGINMQQHGTISENPVASWCLGGGYQTALDKN